MAKIPTYIALLRGINVGGHKKVPMAKLRAILSEIGLKNVKTYIQSGNVVFTASEVNAQHFETKIKEAIKAQFNFNVPVIVKSVEDFKIIFDNCPFSETIKPDTYFVLLSEIPENQLVLEAIQKTYPDEEFHIINDCIYLYCPNGYGKAKFNLKYFERKLNVSATTRNYKTMVKLLSLSDI